MITIRFKDGKDLEIPSNYVLKITTSPHGILEFQIFDKDDKPVGFKMRVKDVDFITI